LNLTILKLGGSVITEKNKPMTENKSHIERLAKEISLSKKEDIILVHGGGSYGHPLAKEYDIGVHNSGIRQTKGVCITNHAMSKLNNILIETLLNNGVSAKTISPSNFVYTKKGEIKFADLSFIKRFLERGIVPVLHGDPVIDEFKGFSILSGDSIANYIAINLNANRIIFGTDVDGVYDKDPKLNKKAQLLETLSLKEIDKIQVSEAISTDTTGGMLGKLNKIRDAVKRGIEVVIVNAKVPNRIYKALLGEKVIGTIIIR
jgi:isopentenyl phosphate kinase